MTDERGADQIDGRHNPQCAEQAGAARRIRQSSAKRLVLRQRVLTPRLAVGVQDRDPEAHFGGRRFGIVANAQGVFPDMSASGPIRPAPGRLR